MGENKGVSDFAVILTATSLSTIISCDLSILTGLKTHGVYVCSDAPQQNKANVCSDSKLHHNIKMERVESKKIQSTEISNISLLI